MYNRYLAAAIIMSSLPAMPVTAMAEDEKNGLYVAGMLSFGGLASPKHGAGDWAVPDFNYGVAGSGAVGYQYQSWRFEAEGSWRKNNLNRTYVHTPDFAPENPDPEPGHMDYRYVFRKPEPGHMGYKLEFKNPEPGHMGHKPELKKPKQNLAGDKHDHMGHKHGHMGDRPEFKKLQPDHMDYGAEFKKQDFAVYSISAVSGMANAWYVFGADLDASVRPFWGAGIGVANLTARAPELGSASHTGLAWQVGGGLEYDIMENTTLTLDLRYFRVLKPEFKWSSTDGDKTLETKYHSFDAGIGLRYRFD